MTISFNNLTPVLAAGTQKLKERDEAEVHCSLDEGHEVTVVMKRVLIDNCVPRGAQSSVYKLCKDSATVTINPPNEALCNIIKKYFLSEKIPGMMGAPGRLFFDEVLINNQVVIG